MYGCGCIECRERGRKRERGGGERERGRERETSDTRLTLETKGLRVLDTFNSRTGHPLAPHESMNPHKGLQIHCTIFVRPLRLRIVSLVTLHVHF